MGYIIGLVVIAHIVGAIILLLYGLVTDPINTLVIIAGFVIFIVLALLALVLFFQIKRFLFFVFSASPLGLCRWRLAGGLALASPQKMTTGW